MTRPEHGEGETAVVESRERIWESPNRAGKSALVNGVVVHPAVGALHASVARTLSVKMKSEAARGGVGRAGFVGCDRRDGQRAPGAGVRSLDEFVVLPARFCQAAHRCEVERVRGGGLLGPPGGA